MHPVITLAPFVRTGEYRPAHSPKTHAHPVALYVKSA